MGEGETHAILQIDISYDTINEGDRWAFYIHELGITCYAEREDQGPDIVKRSVGTILDALQRDPERVKAYLNARGVFYRLEKEHRLEEIPSIALAGMRTDPPKIVRQELALAGAG
jgi:uncharacterized protein (UPF0297 family)